MSWKKEDKRRFEEILNNTVKCKCSCSTVMSSKTDRCVCRWCGNYIYRTPAIEFKYKTIEKLREVENDRG
jgi:hypothetical protein